MKKLKLTGKLSLNKETISKLNDDQMNNVRGGEEQVTYTEAITACLRCPVSVNPEICEESQFECSPSDGLACELSADIKGGC